MKGTHAEHHLKWHNSMNKTVCFCLKRWWTFKKVSIDHISSNKQNLKIEFHPNSLNKHFLLSILLFAP